MARRAAPRNVSAGLLLFRKTGKGLEVLLGHPGGPFWARKDDGAWTIPKGLVDPGEKSDQAALREVREETGITANLITKLTDTKYFYVRSWGDKQRVFKIVSFYLLKYDSGKIDDISPDMRIEVQRASWLPLEEAADKLSYKSERDVARKALEYLVSHPEV